MYFAAPRSHLSVVLRKRLPGSLLAGFFETETFLFPHAFPDAASAASRDLHGLKCGAASPYGTLEDPGSRFRLVAFTRPGMRMAGFCQVAAPFRHDTVGVVLERCPSP